MPNNCKCAKLSLFRKHIEKYELLQRTVTGKLVLKVVSPLPVNSIYYVILYGISPYFKLKNALKISSISKNSGLIHPNPRIYFPRSKFAMFLPLYQYCFNKRLLLLIFPGNIWKNFFRNYLTFKKMILNLRSAKSKIPKRRSGWPARLVHMNITHHYHHNHQVTLKIFIERNTYYKRNLL